VVIAGAPISWGVSEVPGWGHQLRPERVLAEMRELGLTATAAGPDGFLPDDPAALGDYLAAYELELASGFTPLVLHADWRAPLDALEDARAVAGEHGLGVALHPHYGTLVRTPDEIERVLDGCSVPLCLDTGHIVLGGGDPVALARAAAERIAHLHLKDVDAKLAARVADGNVGFSRAVRDGVVLPLGYGDSDVHAVLEHMREAGYAGWYVFEQDAQFAAEPEPGEGPRADVVRSLAYLDAVIAS
jgi:inosose dehydratase